MPLRNDWLDNAYSGLFAAEMNTVCQMKQDIRNKFSLLCEHRAQEIYFFNQNLFDICINFTQLH